MTESSFSRIYEIVQRIPKGKVATYGQVALLAGNPRWSRVVGYALHVNPNPGSIPCHRVVNRFGEVSRAFVFGGENMQRILLTEEGVAFLADGKIDLKLYLWKNEELSKK
ncbi:MAG: MGMT family protein [Clostridiales bacterium]|nr:MGMT family protein [Clostridiales bacterium]